MPILSRVVLGGAEAGSSGSPDERITRTANCLVGDLVGDCVIVSGPPVGGLLQVTKVDITVAPTGRRAIGIITEKATDTECTVQLHGPMIGTYATLTPGGRYFIGADSRLTLSPPAPGGGAIAYAQFMGVALQENELMLSPETAIKRVG